MGFINRKWLGEKAREGSSNLEHVQLLDDEEHVLELRICFLFGRIICYAQYGDHIIN